MEISYRGKSVLVVGAARSGIAAARFLLEAGAQVTLTDMQNLEDLPTLAHLLHSAEYHGKFVLELGGHRDASFSTCDFIVASPGVPLAMSYFDISRRAGIPVIAEIELAARHLKGRIIGITGSNGKTTTTTLVSELLKGAGLKALAAGNIGTPLIDLVAESSTENIYVVELSSFQLEGIDRFRPAVGAMLNLTPDHLDRYSGFDTYIAAKRRIFLNQDKTDFAVLNADDARTDAMAGEVPSTPVKFSRLKPVEYGAYLDQGIIKYRDQAGVRDLLPIEVIHLKGTHNQENILAACTMAILVGANPESLEESVRKFGGVEHRIEFVAEIRGVQYFNDSKATNIDATIKSLEAFPGNILLIAGGRDKAGDFTLLSSLVCERVKHLVLIGEAAEKIRKALAGTAPMSDARSMQEAVSLCSHLAQAGDVVLLAPACASFDMFQDYEHRGREFKRAVHEMLPDLNPNLHPEA